MSELDQMAEAFPPKIGRPATQALDVAGIASFAELARWSREELAALHGVGPKAIGILEEALAEKGLALRVDGSWPAATQQAAPGRSVVRGCSAGDDIGGLGG